MVTLQEHSLAECFVFSRVTQQKLRAIIMAAFGTDRATDDITFAKLKSCQYLHHCMDEPFRMFLFMERVCIKDVTLPKGGGTCGTKPIFVPQGQYVLISTYATQHRADIWGLHVNPDEWEGRETGWEFFPFGAGPRNWVGRKHLLVKRSSF